MLLLLRRRCGRPQWSSSRRAKSTNKNLGFKAFPPSALEGFTDQEAQLILNREAEREHQRVRFKRDPSSEFDVIRQSVAENLDHDIARVTNEDRINHPKWLRSSGAIPSDIPGFVEVPKNSNKKNSSLLQRPQVGQTGLNPDFLPKRVTDSDLNNPNLSEQDFSSSLIHGRSVFPPIYHPQTHAIPVASILFRSHQIDRLELFTHFTSHAAAALGIPISRTAKIPIKRTIWTVLRGPFIDKKSQENFERTVHARMIKAWDAHPEVVDRWIAYLEAHMLGGVGMRVTRWERAPFSIGALRSTYVQNHLGKPEPAHTPKIRDFAEHVHDQTLEALSQQQQQQAEEQQNESVAANNDDDPETSIYPIIDPHTLNNQSLSSSPSTRDISTYHQLILSFPKQKNPSRGTANKLTSQLLTSRNINHNKSNPFESHFPSFAGTTTTNNNTLTLLFTQQDDIDKFLKLWYQDASIIMPSSPSENGDSNTETARIQGAGLDKGQYQDVQVHTRKPTKEWKPWIEWAVDPTPNQVVDSSS